MNCLRIAAGVIALLAAVSSAAGAAATKPRVRRPVALALSPDVQWLYTANRDSGSLSVVDPAKQTVVGEIDVGGRPSALVALPGGKHLLIADEHSHHVLLLAGEGRDWKTASRLKVAHFPVGLVLDSKRSRGFVSSLWSRAVNVVDLSQVARGQLRIVKSMRLPFTPRTMCLTRDGARLIVAGSFDGVLGVIDVDRGEVIAVKRIPGHNIRGLAISADGTQLLTSQQVLSPLGRSSFDDVHWGNMISNVWCSFDLAAVCDPKADMLIDRQERHLGRAGDAAGDPGPITVGRDGRITVALSGVGEVAIGRRWEGLQRVPVGRRPTAVAITPDGKRIFVADTFSDSVSLLDAVDARPLERISLGPQPKLSLEQQGELLFFDAGLSHDGWMSCHSCHTDGHSNGQLNDNLSDGGFGEPKRVLSLLGAAGTGPWAWNGQVKTLQEQVKNSVEKTMRGKAPSDTQAAALVAYLKTLSPPPPPEQFAAKRDPAAVRRGGQLFDNLDCRRCHAPPTYTSAATYDVGLKDSAGNTRFNPPSLRGVGHRRSFFHDGRADSLKEVFTRHKHQIERALPDADLEALLRFLETL